jgi:hypothetical protein
MKHTIFFAAALFALAACDEAPTGTAPSATATSKPTTMAPVPSGKGSGPTTAASADADLDKEDIPVAEDFEEEAEKAINEDNLDDELAKLDKEITEDK